MSVKQVSEIEHVSTFTVVVSFNVESVVVSVFLDGEQEKIKDTESKNNNFFIFLICLIYYI